MFGGIMLALDGPLCNNKFRASGKLSWDPACYAELWRSYTSFIPWMFFFFLAGPGPLLYTTLCFIPSGTQWSFRDSFYLRHFRIQSACTHILGIPLWNYSYATGRLPESWWHNLLNRGRIIQSCENCSIWAYSTLRYSPKQLLSQNSTVHEAT